jgi:hypothetical protein
MMVCVTKSGSEEAAAAKVAAGLGQRRHKELLWLMRPEFARLESFLQAGQYVGAVMSDLPKGRRDHRHGGPASRQTTKITKDAG